jgi:UDP-glucuronate 4-epimerase
MNVLVIDNVRYRQRATHRSGYNIGNAAEPGLANYIAAIEWAVGKTAIREKKPLQAGDTPDCLADVRDLSRPVGYAPTIPVGVGVARFVN